VINPPSKVTDRCGDKSATASALEAASTAHTAKAIKKAAAVYRRDPITRAATTACYGAAPLPALLPRHQTLTDTCRHAWNRSRGHSRLGTILDNLPKPTDQKV
jgi:hypothetical protein